VHARPACGLSRPNNNGSGWGAPNPFERRVTRGCDPCACGRPALGLGRPNNGGSGWGGLLTKEDEVDLKAVWRRQRRSDTWRCPAVSRVPFYSFSNLKGASSSETSVPPPSPYWSSSLMDLVTAVKYYAFQKSFKNFVKCLSTVYSP
jgi:hypothetical protein